VLLFGIQLVRDAGGDFVQVSEAGMWVTLAGAVLAVVGSFFGTRPRVLTSTETHVTDRRAA
jgi:hypothetical protein